MLSVLNYEIIFWRYEATERGHDFLNTLCYGIWIHPQIQDYPYAACNLLPTE